MIVSRSWLYATCLCSLIGTSTVQAQDAASLRARYSAQAKQLIATPFRRPLHLESSESSGASQGDLYAVIARPFGVAGPALQGLDHWCDILILHLNVKQCRQSAADTLRVNIGRKFDQPLGDAYLFQFVYQVVAVKDDYLQVLLTAAHGPLGTSGYRILLEVVALDPTRSFLHLSYAYSAGPVANAAAQVYLATIGRKKVGFSVTGSKDDGEPIYIRGTRGVVERNAMRCYVAIEAYLGSLSLPASEQIEKRLNDWYAGIERYPVQLHEMDRTAYLDMKHKEVARQQLPQGAG